MLTKQEFNKLTREILPKFFIVIPPECIIIRVKDIFGVLEYFTEKEDKNEQGTNERVLHNPDGDSVMGQPISDTDGNNNTTI